MKCQTCGRRSPDSNNFCQNCGAIASDETAPAVIPTARLTPVHTQQSTFEPSRPRPQQTRPAPRPSIPRAAKGGSNVFSTLIFWGLIFYGAYWFMSDDQREIREMLMQWIQQQSGTEQPAPAPPPRRATPVPRATRPAPAETARPAARGRASDAPAPRSSTGAARAAARGSIEAPAARGSAQPATPRGSTPVERETVPALQPRTVPAVPASAPPPTPVPPTQAPPTAPPTGQRGTAPESLEGLSPAQVIQRMGPPANVITSNGVTRWLYQNGALVIYFVKDRATLKPPR